MRISLPALVQCQISSAFIPLNLVIILHWDPGDSTTCYIYQIKLVGGGGSPVSPSGRYNIMTVPLVTLWLRYKIPSTIHWLTGIDLHRLDRQNPPPGPADGLFSSQAILWVNQWTVSVSLKNHYSPSILPCILREFYRFKTSILGDSPQHKHRQKTGLLVLFT